MTTRTTKSDSEQTERLASGSPVRDEQLREAANPGSQDESSPLGGAARQARESDKVSASGTSWILSGADGLESDARNQLTKREEEEEEERSTISVQDSASGLSAATTVASSKNSTRPDLRQSGGGGNLTSESSGSECASEDSTIERQPRTRQPTAAGAQVKDQGQEHLLSQVVSVSAVESGSEPREEEEEEGDTGSEPTTLSSREEYQLARVEMGDEDDEISGAEQPQQQHREVTKIDIDQTGAGASASAEDTAAAAAAATTALNGGKAQVNSSPGAGAKPSTPPRQLPRTIIKLNTTQQPVAAGSTMARSQTSPSQLDQMAPGSPSIRLERGSITSIQQQQQQQQQAPPPPSPALRLIMSGSPTAAFTGAPTPKLARHAPDNMSAHSLALQAKYQGSKHFEIRWQNVRLFARAKSRLPSFISDNQIYKSIFGGADDDGGKATHLDGRSVHNFAFDPMKPPYSPPLNHHKIPPTIDEHTEMRCPRSGGGGGSPTGGLNDGTSSPGPVPAFSLQGDTLRRGSRASEADLAGAGAGGERGSQVRCVLNNISGQVFSGQMTAVLGPSGVGKTSLLNSLTGRNTMDGTGRVSLIGSTESKRMSVVTVPQNDVLPGKLTTLEDLQFTSRLKNPQARFDHRRNIERLVKHLHMDKFLHTRIDKLSGGEARRLSIARELLSSPDILILDEPTSGLDANTCKKIISALRDIVEHSDNILDKPMSIIITIHQPQQEVYQLFHRVYVMAVGGRVVYEGSPQMLLPTLLEQSSLTRVCPPDQLNENPAIVAIEVASGEFGEQIIDELAIYHESQVYEEFSMFGGGGGIGGGGFESPLMPMTPHSIGNGGTRRPFGGHKSPAMSAAQRFDIQSLHRKRLNSFDSSLGRPTPQLARRAAQLGVGGSGGGGNGGNGGGLSAADKMASMTSLSYASTYDDYLPEVTSKLKVDKRLRRSVVIKSHFMSHTRTLIRRCWLLTRRDMFLMAIRILGFLMVAGGTVQIFSDALDPHEHQCPQFESEVDDMASYISSVRIRLTGLLGVLRQGNSVHLFFFHFLLCITMVTSALTGLVFPLQMRMFIREHKNGWYSPASFIMSQTIAELPADIIGPLIAILIAYPLCHQPESAYHWRLIGYALVMIVTSIICKSQAQIVGAFLMDSVENSVFISCVAVTGPALLSGVPLRVKAMPAPLQWASYGSFLRYAFESLLELRYGFGMCPCDSELVHGPLHASARAIPAHMNNLVAGLLDLSTNSTGLPGDAGAETNALAIVNASSNLVAAGASEAAAAAASLSSEHENLFLKFLRLTTDASNLFEDLKEIEDCSSYRSLYLIGMGIPNGKLVFWAALMVCVFVFSRVLTYFAVKTVIKLRRS